MKSEITEYIEKSIQTKNKLLLTNVEVIAEIVNLIVDAYRKGKKVVWFGNGGSAADAQHLACELISKFCMERNSIPSLALTTNTSEITAIANDYDFSQVFSRQVESLVGQGDVVIGITTSGESQNVIEGIKEAKIRGATTVAFTGGAFGKLKGKVDVLLAVPSDFTPHIQESHIMIGHIICYLVEKELFG